MNRTTTRMVILAAALLALAGGVAYATIPDSGNVYTACMLKNVGTIRLIDASLPSTNPMSHCTSLETQVTWNQLGQQGLQGQKGDPGLKGDAGPQGPKGDPGPKGDVGPQGQKGDPGPTGEKGDAGANGAPGATGATGPKGDQGDVGPPGPKGDQGDVGRPGPQGDKGDPGPPGPPGADGKAGAAGPSDVYAQVGGFRVFQDQQSVSVAHQQVDAGHYLLIGKVLVENRALVQSPETIFCRMGIGMNAPTRDNSDLVEVHLDEVAASRGTLSSMMPVDVTAPGYADFNCTGFGGTWSVDYVRFAAVKVGDLHVTSFP